MPPGLGASTSATDGLKFRGFEFGPSERSKVDPFTCARALTSP